jgi:chromosomal replication initiator protein
MEFTAPELWSRVLASAKAGLPEQSYRTWLAGSEAVGLSDEELIVEAPSDFHVEWVEDKYGSLLAELVRRALGRPLRLTFRCAARAAQQRIPSTDVAPRNPSEARGAHDFRRVPRGDTASGTDTTRSNLNERYTFSRFVVGSHNQLAAAAGHAVAERPAKIYNPLFLYGGVGLGKTHLMHAVGHAILQRDALSQVAYVTTERFMNELVNAIQQGTTPAFRRRFRSIDLLLVDDVHFLEQKESTQEEFFHTFNALYDAGKQIVLTSDRPPKELPGVEERLVSRFEWGLVADIKPPDYETRVAILQKKAADDGLAIDPGTIDFIARSCTSSVRELEGAIIKLLAYSSLRNEEITLELARMALQSVLRGRIHPDTVSLTPERIRDEVARSWNVKPDGLISKKRTQEVTLPRQVAMYLIKEILDEPLVRIGQAFGGRDHSTVIHSLRKVKAQLEEDPAFASRVKLLRERLEARP